MMVSEAKKFKVGDKVRLTEQYGRHPIGTVGIVSDVIDDRHDEDLIYTDTVSGVYARRLELVPSVAAWQPKVGDRVVQSTKSNVDIVRHWNDCFRRAFGDIVDGALVVSSIYGDQIGLSNRVGRTNFYMPSDSLQLAQAPATLTIEAGKFYKTRDGRKVGPIESDGDTAWGESPAGYATVFVSTGLANHEGEHKDDFIAEWVDEPATLANDNAAPAKFKVGDLVELTSTGYAADVGATAYVRSVRADGMFDIEWVRNALRNGQTDGGYYLGSFKLVTDTPTPTAIVALIEDGQPKPNTRPYVHATEEAATAEAERLAVIHRGKQFGIYVLADTREADKPSYEHEWKNLAASGEKIQAIKALRGLTGIGLKPAKDAVEYFLAAA